MIRERLGWSGNRCGVAGFVLRNATSLHLAAPTRIKLREWCLSELRDAIEKIDRLIDVIKSTSTRDLLQSKPDGLDASQVTALLADAYLLKCDFISLRVPAIRSSPTRGLRRGRKCKLRWTKAELRIARDWSDRDKLQIARARSQVFLRLPKQSLEVIDGLLKAGKLNRRELMLPAATIAAESYRMLNDIARSEEWLERAGGWRSSPGLAIEHFSNLLASPNGTELQKANWSKRSRQRMKSQSSLVVIGVTVPTRSCWLDNQAELRRQPLRKPLTCHLNWCVQKFGNSCWPSGHSKQSIKWLKQNLLWPNEMPPAMPWSSLCRVPRFGECKRNTSTRPMSFIALRCLILRIQICRSSTQCRGYVARGTQSSLSID